jgi:RHS repeat-associated protein
VGPYGERLGQVDLATQSAAPTYRWHASTRADTLPGAAGIVIVGARAYLPATGQFLSADPLVDSGQNLYGYTDGDPVNAKDSSGNESDTDWTWVWVAAASALLTLAIGVGGASTKGSLPTGLNASSSSWSKFKAVARANPGKAALYGLGVASSVTAGVGAAMAVRNQVSESWQAIAIGIGAAAATFGAGYLGAKSVARIRKARFNKSLDQEPRGSWVDFEVTSTRHNSLVYGSQESATHTVPLRVQYGNVMYGAGSPSSSLGGLENRASSLLDHGSFTGDVFANRNSVDLAGSAYGA